MVGIAVQMFDPLRLMRAARRALARLPARPLSRIPEGPGLRLRDLWPGEPLRGARLLKGELEVQGSVRPLLEHGWSPAGATEAWRAAAWSFGWIRDLRALGSDAARMRARALVLDWLEATASMPLASRGDVAGARIAAWLGHWDWLAATAEPSFREAMMATLMADARRLAASLPAEEQDVRSLVALKGLVVAGAALPGGEALLARALRFLPAELDRQFLPDGSQVERSPAAQLAALVELIEIRAALTAAGADAPASLADTIERAAAALRSLRHGDGGLALFNGTREENAQAIDLVLLQAHAPAAARARPSAAQLATGFQRLAAGRTVVIVDCGPPPPRGLDLRSHAGTLSFEMSVGRDRLIVNCGAAPAGPAEWRDALRATAAHSTLTLADVNAAELRDHGLGRRPEQVHAARREAEGATWLEASHDGWRRSLGAIHHRRLYLSESGDDLRGEDVVEAPMPQGFALRFHLHPGVKASLQQNRAGVLLRLPGAGGFVLRATGAELALEESIYAGSGEPRRTEQVVLMGRAGEAQAVKWAITRVG